MRKVQAQSASVDTQVRQRPRPGPANNSPCRHYLVPSSSAPGHSPLCCCWGAPATDPVSSLSASRSKALAKVSDVSLFCPPGHRKRECHRGQRGTLPPAELGPVSNGGERLAEEQAKPHCPLWCLSPDSQRDCDPTTSARKDYELLHQIIFNYSSGII